MLTFSYANKCVVTAIHYRKLWGQYCLYRLPRLDNTEEECSTNSKTGGLKKIETDFKHFESIPQKTKFNADCANRCFPSTTALKRWHPGAVRSVSVSESQLLLIPALCRPTILSLTSLESSLVLAMVQSLEHEK